MESKIHDSGKRQSFEGGAVRDSADDKPRIDLISPFALERLGHWMRLGAEKYAERNWETGMPISRCVASMHRHLNKYQQGCTDEDHLAAILFNAMAIAHYEEMIARGHLRGSIDDMPFYGEPRHKAENNQNEVDRLGLYDILYQANEASEAVHEGRDFGDECDVRR